MLTLDAVRLHCGPLEAAFDPEAGMAGVSLRHRGEELLGPLGIPFLHPWANRLAAERYSAAGRAVTLPADLPREEHGLAIHGVPPSRWRVVDTSEAGAHAVLDFPEHPAFPFPHRVEQRITLSDEALTVETSLAATGEAAVPVAFGFHPYFTLRRDWQVGLPARRRLVADERLIPTGETVPEAAEEAVLGARTFDDGYRVGDRARFTLTGAGRTLELGLLRGYPCAQVFAPRAEDVICFEPMTAPANALVTGDGLRLVAPGCVFAAAFEIVVRG